MEMLLFVLIYFLIYGLMNYYACHGLLRQFVVPLCLQRGLVLFALIMMMSPFAMRLLDAYGFSQMAVYLAYSAFYWMGFVVLFDSAFLIYDFFQFISRNKIPLYCRYLPLGYALLAMVYGSFEAGHIRLKTFTFFSNKIISAGNSIKVLQISDLHLGIMTRSTSVRKVIDLIRKTAPDVLISTGDLIDHCQGFDLSLLKEFSDLSVPYGKYAILGNHELYAGLSQAMALTEKAGFKLLLNETVVLKNGLKLTGMKDGISLKEAASDTFLAEEIKQNRNPSSFSILLNHRPEVCIPVLKHFDLQLSGHTHKGQIFPFNFVTWLFFPVKAGKITDLGEEGKIYVSPGTGTWGPPLRVLAFPEITCFNLLPEMKDQGK